MYDDRSITRAADVADFARSAGLVLDAAWGAAVDAPRADLAAVHRVAAEQGWYDLAEEGAVDFLRGVVRELGRRSCPLPVVDAYVAASLCPDLAAPIAAGEVRPVVVDRLDALVDGADGATHVLHLDQADGELSVHPVLAVEAVDGLAVPAWSRLSVGGVVSSIRLGRDRLDWSRAVRRLGLATRALAAAERVHELSVAHAVARHQFGRAIGGFGAVQQRVATVQIELAAGSGLVDQAIAALLAGAEDAPLAAALAARHVRDAAVGAMSGAQHTLGAVGYFEEHEAAWLFRRVHADVSLLRAGALDDADAGVAAYLLDGDADLPGLALGSRAEAFRDQVHALLGRHRTGDGFDAEGLRAEMADGGYFALGWPSEHGGRPASVEEQVVLHEELKYAGGPVDRAMSATMLIGHSLLTHGTAEQCREFLPLIREGRMAFCLGYSEPEAGSDLASLRTRAVRDGDAWVIDGQKLWTTRGHTATHVWLAVRTDPDAHPRHAGITIFLVPMDTPGIEVQQHRALSGEISCTVFYDAVRVPDSARVGEVDGGWAVITGALAAERVVMGGVAATLRRQLDEMLTLLRSSSSPLDALGRDRLAAVAARLQAARVLVLAATHSMDGGPGPGAARMAGPMAAVLSGDLAEDLGRTALDLLGPSAALAGRFDDALRLAPMYVIGGGTNDIQRAIIARSLGLPRE